MFNHEYVVTVRLGRNTDDTAGKTGTCITSLKGLLIAALAEVVSTGVDDEASTNDGVRAVEGDDLVGKVELSGTAAVRLDITEVTNVPLGVGGSTVVLFKGVVMGASRGTAVGVVSKLVDVHASLGVSVHVLNLTSDANGSIFRLLGEAYSAVDVGFTLEDNNSLEIGRAHV